MLVSIDYVRCDGYDGKRHRCRDEYKIVDTDFGVVKTRAVIGLGPEVGIACAVIVAYSKRKLSVAANIIRGFQYHTKRFGGNIHRHVSWNKQYNPKYLPYADEVDRLLVLL